MHCAAVAATRPCRVARCDIRVRLAAWRMCRLLVCLLARLLSRFG